MRGTQKHMSFPRIILLSICAMLIGGQILQSSVAIYDQKILQARADLGAEHNENTLLLSSSAHNATDLKASLIALKADYQLTSIQALSDTNSTFKVQFADHEDLAMIMASRSDLIELEPDYIFSATSAPTDPLFNEQWYLHNTGQNYHASSTIQTHGTNDVDLNWQEAYDTHPERGEGITIALIDSGITVGHPDLTGQIWTNTSETTDSIDNDGNGLIDDVNGWNFVNNNNDLTDALGHGTQAAGIMVAQNDTQGIIGIASSAKIMPLKVLDSLGHGSTSNVIKAINYAVDKGAKIINMSFGARQADTLALVNTCNAAVAAGVTLVAAAGNENQDIVQTHFSPANIPSVIAVGSVSSAGAKASFSNIGTALSVVAPGVSLLTTRSHGSGESAGQVLNDGSTDYIISSGTSFSSPMVAAVAALLLQQDPAKTPAQVRDRLESTARDLGSTGKDNQYGFGLVNIAAALTSGITTPPPTINQAPTILSASWSQSSILNDDSSSTLLTMTVHDQEQDNISVQADLSALGSTNETLTNVIGDTYQSLPITTNVSAGDYSIPLQVSDALHTATGSIILTVSNAPATLNIVLPSTESNFNTTESSLTFSGTVSNHVSSIEINDIQITGFSLGQTSWSQSVAIPEGTTAFNVNGYNSNHQLVVADSIVITRPVTASPEAPTETSTPVTVRRSHRTVRHSYAADPVITAQTTPAYFLDLPSDHFAFSQIVDLAQKGAVQGINNYFLPNRWISRGEFLKIAMRDAGLTNENCSTMAAQFVDSTSSSFSTDINCGVYQRILSDSPSNFSPYAPLTRDQAILWLVAIRRVSVVNHTQNRSFLDVQDPIIAPYIETALAHQWISGLNGLFYPHGNLTRAEAAKIIVNSRH